jgi:hypothetical protein
MNREERMDELGDFIHPFIALFKRAKKADLIGRENSILHVNDVLFNSRHPEKTPLFIYNQAKLYLEFLNSGAAEHMKESQLNMSIERFFNPFNGIVFTNWNLKLAKVVIPVGRLVAQWYNRFPEAHRLDMVDKGENEKIDRSQCLLRREAPFGDGLETFYADRNHQRWDYREGYFNENRSSIPFVTTLDGYKSFW